MVQDSRRVETVEEQLCGQIEHWLDTPIGAEHGFDDLDGAAPLRYRDEVCVKEVYAELMDGEAARLDQRTAQTIGKALRMLPGWHMVNCTKTARYGRQRVWRRNRAG